MQIVQYCQDVIPSLAEEIDVLLYLTGCKICTEPTMSNWALLKRSSLSISRVRGIKRLNIRPFLNEAGDLSSSFDASGCGDDQWPGYFSASFLRSVSGILMASGLGFWYWSSPFSWNSLFSFADWPATTKNATTDGRQQHSSFHESAPEKKPRFILTDAYRRKIFFNYEKRIRMRSPPEKVFEYFASFRTPGGEVLMTPVDLMRAVIPVFPPSESNSVREGYLRGERSTGELRCAPSNFFLLFDTNNDGMISFPEYIFFVTLLSIPESSFSVAFKMFDLDNNGEIDREEFKKVMALMRSHNRQGANHSDGLRIGLKASGSVENGGLLEYFFGKDGASRLQLGKFVQFLRDLHDEILQLEFAHYDYELRGSISAKDFGLSMVSSADMSHINIFLDRVEELNNEPHLKDVRISLEEFKNFAELRRRIQPLYLAIFSYGKANGSLRRKDFQRAASQVCGISLTDNVVDIIFRVFDANRDGSLSSEEFIRVLQKRETDVAQPMSFMGLISCWLNCARDCSFAKVPVN